MDLGFGFGFVFFLFGFAFVWGRGVVSVAYKAVVNYRHFSLLNSGLNIMQHQSSKAL